MKKRVLSLLLALLMVCTLLPATAFAVGEPIGLTITADKPNANVGEEITFTMSLASDNTKPLTGINVTLSIPAGLTYVANSGAVADGLGTAMEADDASFTEESKVFILAKATALPLAATQTLMTFKCTASTAGSYSVTVLDDEFLDDSADPYTKGTEYSITPAAVSVTKLVTSVVVKTAPTKTAYVVGQSFDPAGTVLTVNYSDSTTEDIAAADFATKGVTYSPTGALAITDDKISFSYCGKSDDQTISVTAKAISSIAVGTPSSKLAFKQDEDFTYPGLTVIATYNDGTTGTLATNAYTVTGSTATVGNGQTATIKLNANNSITTTYAFDVTAKALTSIDITTEPTKTSYTVGETFSTTGMVVKAYYDNGKNKTLLSTDYTVTGDDTSTVSTGRTVTVSYTDVVEKTDSFTITVSAAKLTASAPTLAQGDTSGLKVTWGAITHATGYTVKIYQGTTLKKTITSATSPLSVDVDGTDILRGTSYTATLTAIGDPNYGTSDESAKSSAISAKGKTLTTAAFSVTNASKTYTGSALAPTVSYTGTYTTANAGAITFGLGSSHTATAIGAATYDIFVKTAGGTVYDPLTAWTDTTSDFVVSQASTNTVTLSAVVGKGYDGNPIAQPTVTATFGTASIQYKKTSEANTAYSTTLPSDAGSYNVRAHVEGTTNYVGGNSTVQSFTISKADLTASVANKSVRFDTTAEQTVSASDFGISVAGTFSSGGTPTDAGSVLNTTPTYGSTVKFALKSGLSYSGQTVEIPVTFTPTSTNYNSKSGLKIMVTITNKATQSTLTCVPSNTTVEYGRTLTLGSTGGSGSGAVTYSVTNDTGEATVSGSTLTATKAGTITVKATKAGDTAYNEAISASVTITISKASLTGNPTYTAISTTGKTLADVTLTKPAAWPAGTFTWVLDATTEVTANTAYNYTFTPGDGTNYETKTGSVTPYVVSTGGGGGGGAAVTTPTVTEPTTSGGTTTVTTTVTPTTSGTTATAAVPAATANTAVSDALEAAKQSDTAPVVEIEVKTPVKADSIEVTLPAAAIGTLSENEDAELVISSGVADITLDAAALATIAKKAGTDVTVSVEPVASSELNERQKEAIGDAPVYDISIASGSTTVSDLGGGSVSISVPYTLKAGENAKNLVAYYLDDNGNLQRCKTNYDETTKKLTFVTPHLSKYVVLSSAAAVFIDVDANDYYFDAVAWAVEKGVTQGTSDTTFSPADSCTRAQMAAFLYRAAGSPEPTSTVNPFTDVKADAYYYKAVLWAVEKGITLGTGDGTTFSPDDTCTRGQMATFLYRYAESPAVTGSNPFTDVAISDYYCNAVIWAAAEGVTQGTSTTTFSPKDDCTRGQIVTFLYRFITK